jgi:hypothetical protein
MARKPRSIGEVSLSAIEDERQRQATLAAIAAARDLIKKDGVIPAGTPVGRLSDTEWGWLLAAILFAWINERAKQATAERLDTEEAIRLIATDPCPWDAGAIESILPALAEKCSDLDWSKPVGAWAKTDIVTLLLKALPLACRALVERDHSARGVTTSASVAARQANAAAGGPLMTPAELPNDDISDLFAV